MPTAAERYNFAEVEKDRKNYISELLKQCKVHAVTDAKKEKMVNLGTKDELALELIERKHMLILNQLSKSSYFF